VQAVDDAGHVLAVVDVGGLGEEDARQADVLHGGEPVVDVVGVAEVEAVQLVLGLVLVVDALEGHLLGAEEVGQLGQVHAVAQVLLALAGASSISAAEKRLSESSASKLEEERPRPEESCGDSDLWLLLDLICFRLLSISERRKSRIEMA